MYILREDIKDIDELVRWLENHMITRSEYSCKKQDMRAITIHFGGLHGMNAYVFCSDKMCSLDPYISWLNCRKRYQTEDEFITILKNKLDESHMNK